MRMRVFRLFTLLPLLVPLSAFANVAITEVMYDVSGSDSGREWVEIQNQGTDAVDVSGWRFFEEGVNHKLSSNAGYTLKPGEYAVIADKESAFRTDWANYSGLLFESSFSLKNTGETLELRDSSLKSIASAAYSSGEAEGDGNSLNLVSGSFVPRRPSPSASVSADVIPPPAPKVVKATKPEKALKSTYSLSNQPTSVEVRNMNAIDGGGKGVEASAAAFVSGGGGRTSLLPWVASLVAVIGIGIVAVFGRKRMGRSGYTIIEIQP